MDDRPSRSHAPNDRAASALAPPSAQKIMDDLAASEADEAAGRTDARTDLLAGMDRTAARIRAKLASRRE
jgi:hypothetical protein